ncbi:hypothetical protein [Cyclonatronum proteinivorum]|uniref:hypothetical protein n=1 Tax=Cyclonatronum proteinivorum TaxID=1457365 RepID=UPI0013DECB4F|nr:hypothetical protein [Cyclonatronum proteinivorum]
MRINAGMGASGIRVGIWVCAYSDLRGGDHKGTPLRYARMREMPEMPGAGFSRLLFR